MPGAASSLLMTLCSASGNGDSVNDNDSNTDRPSEHVKMKAVYSRHFTSLLETILAHSPRDTEGDCVGIQWGPHDASKVLLNRLYVHVLRKHGSTTSVFLM